MNKVMVSYTLLCLGLLLFFYPAAIAAEIVVPLQVEDLQAAINEANDGDTILVEAGVYTGPFIIDEKSINLISSSGQLNTILRNEDMPDKPILELINCKTKQIILSGFTFRDSDYGIGCNKSSPEIRESLFTKIGIVAVISHGEGYPEIHNNEFSGNPGMAILCSNLSKERSGGVLVWNNTFSENDAGIHIKNMNAQIFNNLLREHKSSAITLSTNTNASVLNNLIYNNQGYGIASAHSNICCLIFNTISENGIDGIYLISPLYARVDCNIITKNARDGIRIARINNSVDLSAQNNDSWDNSGVNYLLPESVTTNGNISKDPLWISKNESKYLLSQQSAGQPVNSSCVDGGNVNANEVIVNIHDEYVNLTQLSTRTDNIGDSGISDLGYHYNLVQGGK